MITIQGKGVSAGVGVGPLYYYRRATAEIKRYTVEDTDAEWHRFKGAQTGAVEQLGQLAEQARAEAGDEAAMLFETHQMMAEDLDYEEAIEDRITNQKMNAEAAVSDTAEQFAEMFASMDDAYMQARAADVKDVSQRILSILCGVVQGGIASDVPVLLAADDLAPSETIQLDKSKILGFVTAGGSGSSHTAILARTMGIPAVVGVGDAAQALSTKAVRPVADGEHRRSWSIDPDDDTRDRLLKKREEQQRLQRLLETLKGQRKRDQGRQDRHASTATSARPRTWPRRAGQRRRRHRPVPQRVPLSRTPPPIPTEDEQFEAYKHGLSEPWTAKRSSSARWTSAPTSRSATSTCPKRTTPPWVMRALRICLTRPEIFRTQLRALYPRLCLRQAGHHVPHGHQRVGSAGSQEAVRGRQAQTSTHGRASPYSEDIADRHHDRDPGRRDQSATVWPRQVDFFSVGTNDLTQYTLACDRQNNDLGRFYDPHHPAVLRLIKLVTENAHKNGIWVGICGELGADLALTETFLAMGLDELSVTPRAVLPLRNAVRMTDTRESAERLMAELDADYTAR